MLPPGEAAIPDPRASPEPSWAALEPATLVLPASDMSSEFRQRLEKLQPEASGRRWLFVPYDQLTDQLGPLSREPPAELGCVLVESSWKASRRPYHQQKLALVLANMRRFALEQAARGVAIRYLFHDGPYRTALTGLLPETGPLRLMEPAERELRHDLEPLVEEGAVEILPHEGWLTTEEQFAAAQAKNGTWRMDTFYRRVRRDGGILMKNGRPLGGKFSFDAENRQRWPGEPPAPTPPSFPLDPVKEEVGRLVREKYADHPGRLDLERLPTRAEDAHVLWRWAQEECLEHFGPYEDAMSCRSRGLFHTRVSALLNLHRLLPPRLVEEALASKAPLPSREGFVRQILGWREFVRHVHRATDGFRQLPEEDGMPPGASPETAASPSFLGAHQPLPAAFWGHPSGLECLDQVVEAVWEEAYSHHITRLMVLANIATLLDVSPRELTDWFWAAYTDAYDWVVEPNVLGMGTFAAGDLMTTKPYVAGANYIHRMSDYCDSCSFEPRSNCPLTPLYWAFLSRHRERLEENPRMKLALAAAAKRSTDKRRKDRAVYDWVRATLAAQELLEPQHDPRQAAGDADGFRRGEQ